MSRPRGAARRAATIVGRTITRRSPWRIVQPVCVALAVAVLALACASVAVVTAQYAGAAQVASERGIRFPELFPDEPVVAVWAYDTVVLDSGQQAALVAVAAVADSPPLPPGVPVWPEPGQIVVSPAWQEQADDLPFGGLDAEVVGTIGPDGLVDPGEILAYVGGTVDQVADGGGYQITGFGSERSPLFGTMLYRQPVWWLQLAIALLVVAPSWLLLVTALRMGAGARARREQIMAHLGAPRGFTRWVRMGEVARPIGWGAGLALLALCLVMAFDVYVPGAGYVLRASFNRASWWLLMAAVTVALLAAVVTARTRVGLRAEQARERVRRRVPALADAVSAPFVAASMVIAFNLSTLNDREAVVLPLFWGGVLATVLLVPRSARGLLTLWATRARRRARAAGDAGALVGTAQVLARPRPYGRFGAVAASAIILLAVVGRFTLVWGSDMAEARTQAGAVTHDVGIVGIPWAAWNEGADAQAVLNSAVGALSGDFHVIGINSAGDTLVGSPDDLAAFGLRDGQAGTDDPAAQTAFGSTGSQATARAESVIGSDAAALYIRTRSGGPVDRGAANAMLAEVILPPLRVAFSGELATAGAAVNLHQARWLDASAAVGMAILVAGLWAGYTNELLRMRRNLLPAQAMAPDRKFTRAATWTRVVTPVALFAILGSAIAFLVSLPLMNLGSALVAPPWTAVVTGSTMLIGSSLVAWYALSSSIAARSMSLEFAQGNE